MNRTIGGDHVKNVILENEDRFSKALDRVAGALLGGHAEKRPPRILRLSGPTCSGKTTAAKMLAERFARFGMQLHSVSLDDFFYNTEHLRARSSGEGIDYDSEETLDLDELMRFTDMIRNGREALCPIFNFKTGNREGFRTIRSGENDCFLFEGIQALYPGVERILSSCDDSEKSAVGIYIAPMTPVSAGGEVFAPNELRLLRRLVRDYNFRATEPEFTLSLWSGVRNNEELHIFPYIHTCEHWIDSSMTYEIGVLKPYLEQILARISKESPYRAEADSILHQINGVTPIPKELIPSGSLYTEFI